MARDLAPGQRIADIVIGPDLAVRRQGERLLGEATRGERNIAGDANIARPDMLGDPVIGREPFETTKTSRLSRSATR